MPDNSNRYRFGRWVEFTPGSDRKITRAEYRAGRRSSRLREILIMSEDFRRNGLAAEEWARELHRLPEWTTRDDMNAIQSEAKRRGVQTERSSIDWLRILVSEAWHPPYSSPKATPLG